MRSLLFILSIFLFLCKTNTSFSQTVYTFNGKGNWSDSANWVNKLVPPVILPDGDTIVIDPAGGDSCVLDISQLISPGAFLRVLTGKKLKLSNNLLVNHPNLPTGLSETDPDSLLTIPLLDTSTFFPLQQELPPDFALDIPEAASQGADPANKACAAFAAAYTVRSYLLHRDRGISYYYPSGELNYTRILSPEYLYNLGNNHNGPCEEATMDYFNAFKVMKEKGVSTWDAMPYTETNGCKIPDASQDADAANFKIDGYFRITDISAPYIKRILQERNPILIAVKLDQGFTDLSWFNRYIPKVWKSHEGTPGEFHALVLYGWNDDLNAYLVRSSWGKDWGFYGSGWIGYDFLKEVLAGKPGAYEVYTLKTSWRDVVPIGSQIWAPRNLDVDHYKNWDPIPQVQDPVEWANLTTGAWCYYNNDPANGDVYGKLYNWYAVHDDRGLAPEGWHIPTNDEWATLRDQLGGACCAGGKMKEEGTAHWTSLNVGADNSSGFTGLPGGQRTINSGYTNSFFTDMGVRGLWWSFTESNGGGGAYNGGLGNSGTSMSIGTYPQGFGHSVRCVKD